MKKPQVDKNSQSEHQSSHMTELMIAAKAGNIRKVHDQIKEGQNINAGCKRSIWEWNKTALMYASETGRYQVVVELLEAGADPNLTDRSISEDSGGKIALHYAARAGYRDIVEALISANSKLGIVDEAGSTALMLACENGHLQVIDCILGSVLDDKARKRMAGEALLSAVVSLGVFRKSVKNGRIVSKRTTTTGRVVSVVERLLACKPDTNVISKEYGTALERAAGLGALTVVKLLVEAGANPNLRSRHGDCPLRQAAESAHVKVVEYLLEQGADPLLCTYDGLTPLDAARRIGAVRNKKRMAEICKLMETSVS